MIGPLVIEWEHTGDMCGIDWDMMGTGSWLILFLAGGNTTNLVQDET